VRNLSNQILFDTMKASGRSFVLAARAQQAAMPLRRQPASWTRVASLDHFVGAGEQRRRWRADFRETRAASLLLYDAERK
jgi:hypothetical protein